MPFEKSEKRMYTLNDIAKELGVNKATVSKAISGKGNLSADTRARILEYIEKCGYKPNAVAQSLARNRAYNIGLMMPDPSGILEGSFFRDCLSGVYKTAAASNYDVLMILDGEESMDNIARLIDNRKIDGVIAMRSLVKSPIVGFLKKKQVPFVLIGPTSDPEVMRVDNDNQAACREMTSLLISRGVRKMIVLGGDEENCVTHSRLRGFWEACDDEGVNREDQQIFLNVEKKYRMAAERDSCLKDMLSGVEDGSADCIVCMDEYICNYVMIYLRNSGIRVPRDVKVVSYYDNVLLENNIPPVSSLRFDAQELGRIACRRLLNKLENKPDEQYAVPGYQVILRESTN